MWKGVSHLDDAGIFALRNCNFWNVNQKRFTDTCKKSHWEYARARRN